MKRPIEPCYRLIGARIEQIRNTLGWSQAEFAAKVGLKRASIANIEGGNQRFLVHDVETFATAFGMTPKAFLKGIWI